MHIKKLGQKINIIKCILKFLPKFNAINDHFILITNSWWTIKNNVHYLTYFCYCDEIKLFHAYIFQIRYEDHD